jgi:hypothetical protein
MRTILNLIALVLLGLAVGCGSSDTPSPPKNGQTEDGMSIRVYRGDEEIILPDNGSDGEDNVGPCNASLDNGWLSIVTTTSESGETSYEITLRYSILNGGTAPVGLQIEDASECEVTNVGGLNSVPPGGGLLIADAKPDGGAGSEWSFRVKLTASDGTERAWKVTGTLPE